MFTHGEHINVFYYDHVIEIAIEYGVIENIWQKKMQSILNCAVLSSVLD